MERNLIFIQEMTWYNLAASAAQTPQLPAPRHIMDGHNARKVPFMRPFALQVILVVSGTGVKEGREVSLAEGGGSAHD